MFAQSSPGEKKLESVDVVAALKKLEEKAVSPYDLSIIVLSSSQVLDEALYDKSVAKLETALSELPDDSFKAWMLGRMAQAGNEMKKNIEKPLSKLKEILKKCKPNEESAWAIGYLAAINETEYKECEEKMLKAASILVKKPDALWAHVMNLQAAANAGIDKTYQQILQAMRDVTGKLNIKDALNEIPAADWRAWAFAITLRAAATKGDKILYLELEQPTRKAIDDAIKTNSTANATMAQIYADKAGECYELLNKRRQSHGH